MARRKNSRYSGIGGQAVLEGIMMKNSEKYAVAVRKPNGEISVELENYQGVLHGSKIKEIPFIRGIFNFIDSMILGMRVLNYSASFYEEEDNAGSAGADRTGGSGEKFVNALVTVAAIVMAVGIFVVLPYFLASLLKGYVRNESLMAIIEGAIRIFIFILYVWGISAMKDIKRLYRYHGAEHKCINCVEKGRPLTLHNVMRSSRLHRRCGTSFLFFVFFVSIILFFFIRVDSVAQKVILRILLMPVVAGISYEIIRLAGRSDNILVLILSVPGMLIQRMTTKEPDESMAEVAIAAVEAVFDWRQYLYDNFGYEVDESWMDGNESSYADQENDADGASDWLEDETADEEPQEWETEDPGEDAEEI
ncbi:MAG: DUF1385 domain-containing protein [Eubacterium sp.]|nr:DUF1385 domain-containing protein [Eubacterium sp.]MCM1216062.1 DUF1385 domain-containing protein [Lachnospiraceae bacterium]MCM1239829.1 DUF1385 domain-containing protein [Lachnospiraceae bacterium]MCM1343698.1 DUF1385 domain-containing protein [Muribaculaceae bacterium]MCM1410203.1 DUF1385 domain-containing protein [Lachnospiraceae bacterium]